MGALCNLGCTYCYYLEKEGLYAGDKYLPMTDQVLEQYIRQHVEASTEKTVLFSWHGGEPTVLGLDYFRRIVEVQKRCEDPKRRICNGIQTNGTLLTEAWCRFFAQEGFSIGLSLDGPQELHDKYRLARLGLMKRFMALLRPAQREKMTEMVKKRSSSSK